MIFECERLIVRKLILSDLNSFHKMQSNPKVMQFADGEVQSLSAHKKEILELINKYDIVDNNFWIYAIERKKDSRFVGTLALVKDGKEDEIGYRFLEEYWNKGYGFEICKATISYCRKIGLKKIVGYVVDENKASAKILERLNFKIVKKFISNDIKLPETKYELKL
ncbi:MAG: GNAT family N-acetyltransferase [Polaribacter sp.]|uniref:GNAT family N-acetyltransferase n=1 Tax=Polaribacter sp. TaxID=1920175 RepID=UPI003BAE8918